jgi:hypothetical protein
MFWLFCTWIIVWILWHAYTSGLRDRARRLEALARLEAERMETAYRVATGVIMAQQALQQQQAEPQPVAEEPARRNYYLERAEARDADAEETFRRLMNK